MASYRHPDRASHVQKHAVFLEEAQGVLQELEAKGVTVPFRRWVVGRLPEWFRLHIIEHDVKLGRFLVKTGAVSELAPPEAV
jgi:hemerythrin